VSNDSDAAPIQGRVLIVDDDPSVTDTFTRMLRLEGFEVVPALSAEDGLVLVATQPPDAVILDMRMPILNGLNFLRQFRRLDGMAAVPVAIVTGDYHMDDAISTELLGLGAQIKFKPMWLEDLVTLARELVAEHRAQA